MKLGSLLATIMLFLVAIAHLLRLILGVELLANGTVVPQWLSIVGVLVPGTIAVLLVRERRVAG